jgi:2-phospho-L-lactate guanylyltransferase
MRILVPFDSREPNTRLSPLFDHDERQELAATLLDDVLVAIRNADHEPEILATEPIDRECPVHVDTGSLTAAVNTVLETVTEPISIVMADLGLATSASINRLTESEADVILAPGIGGGTNAICIRHPDFRVDYHDGSYRKHRRKARDCGARLRTVDSFRLALDIDEPADLAEVLLHGDGHTAEWLRAAGVELDTRDGRCTVRRNTS